MIVGFERTTDMRHPETVMRKLRNITAARKWIAQGGGYAWPGAADETLPASQQNWHRRFRYAFVMPVGWRWSKRLFRKETAKAHHSDYCPTWPEWCYGQACRYGEELEAEP